MLQCTCIFLEIAQYIYNLQRCTLYIVHCITDVVVMVFPVLLHILTKTFLITVGEKYVGSSQIITSFDFLVNSQEVPIGLC